jgi:hypothetical protein
MNRNMIILVAELVQWTTTSIIPVEPGIVRMWSSH